MPSTFESNFKLLKERFPKVAEFAISRRDCKFSVMKARDGGVYYAVKNSDGSWQAVSDPIAPMKQAQRAIDSMASRLASGFCPALVVGLSPGYVLDTVFGLFESQAGEFSPFRDVYVVVDSPLCLCGWLASGDKSKILSKPEVSFHTASGVQEIVELCKRDVNRSHLFIPVSELPVHAVNGIIDPLSKLYLDREAETEAWRKENDACYSAVSDVQLAAFIGGRGGRKPRLMLPTHAASTVIQFSARDACELFEAAGWEVALVRIEKDLPPWRLVKSIRDFKPDLFLFIDHLRTEDAEGLLYPKDMLFATWVQDSLPAINSRKAAEAWNKAVAGRRRDLLIGYVDQLAPYGYDKDRLFQIPMVVNPRIFRPLALSKEDGERYSCDVCFASNRGESSESVVTNSLLPALEGRGFGLDVLMEVHDALWKDYRSGRSYIDYRRLQIRLCKIFDFKKPFARLDCESGDFVVQRVFWLLNDLIYRYVVLEWLDDYAQANPGFKLKLYGRAWARHPRFGRYAAGPVEHGPELNKAYNGAKLCLHLNSLEGQHQRLWELCAANATILTRRSKVRMARGPLVSGLKRLVLDGEAAPAEGLRIDFSRLQGMRRLERHAVLDLLFNEALSVAATPSVESLPDALSALESRVSSAVEGLPELSVNEANRRFFDSREELYGALSEGAPASREGSRAANLSRSLVVNLSKAILSFMKVDSVQGEPPPPGPGVVDQLLGASLAAAGKTKSLSAALECVKPSAAAGPLAFNAMAEWLLSTGRAKELRGALRGPSPSGRGSLGAKTAKAFFQLRSGDLEGARASFDAVALEFPSLRDLRAAMSWRAFEPFQEYERAVEFFEKDSKEGRLGKRWTRHRALALASAGRLEEARALLERSCAAGKGEKDSFAFVGWYLHCLNWHFAKALPWFEKDREAKRLSPQWMLHRAECLAASGLLDEAVASVEEAYGSSRSVRNGFAIVGFNSALAGRKGALKLFERDLDLGRMTRALRLAWAEAAFMEGSLDLAGRIVEDSRLPWTCVVGFANQCNSYGKGGAPDFELWIAKLRRDLDSGRASLETYMLLVLAAILSGRPSKAVEFREAGDKAFPKGAPLLHSMHASFAWLRCRGEGAPDLSCFGAGDFAVRHDYLPLAAFSLACQGELEGARLRFEELNAVSPFYFARRNAIAVDHNVFLGLALWMNGERKRASAFLDFAKANSLAWRFCAELVGETLSKGFPEGVPFPEFSLGRTIL